MPKTRTKSGMHFSKLNAIRNPETEQTTSSIPPKLQLFKDKFLPGIVFPVHEKVLKISN